MGRFMSPDWADKPEAVPYSDLTNPQSLNLYSYVNNNPLTKADKDGHFPECMVWGDEAMQYISETPAGQEVGNAIGLAGAALGGFIAANAGGIASSYVDAVSQGGGATTAVYVGPIYNSRTAQDALPRDEGGRPVPDAEAAGNPHTQLGTSNGRKGPYTQGREFDANGKPVKDIDHTDHGRASNHTNRHEHPYRPSDGKRMPQQPVNPSPPQSKVNDHMQTIGKPNRDTNQLP